MRTGVPVKCKLNGNVGKNKPGETVGRANKDEHSSPLHASSARANRPREASGGCQSRTTVAPLAGCSCRLRPPQGRNQKFLVGFSGLRSDSRCYERPDSVLLRLSDPGRDPPGDGRRIPQQFAFRSGGGGGIFRVGLSGPRESLTTFSPAKHLSVQREAIRHHQKIY